MTLLLPLAGCLDPVQSEPILLWEGELEPRPGASVYVEGQVAMVVNPSTTQIGIGVSGVENLGAGEVLLWEVREGRCEDTGPPVADPGLFPSIRPSAEGGGGVDIVLQRRVAGEASYATEVGIDRSGSVERLACGNLERRS